MHKTMQFIFSWIQASPDVSVQVGNAEAKWLTKETTPCLVAYMAHCALYQLENNTKEMTEDVYLDAVTDMLNFYIDNKEKIGANAELDRLVELGKNDFENFEKEVRANFPKTE